MTGPDPLEYGWWLASRAAGVTAYLFASIAVIGGLMMAGRVASTPSRKRIIRQVHEHAALAGLVAMAVHGITLLGDRWLHPGVAGVLVPFVIDYKPLAVASGIVAAYAMAGLGLSFYVKRRVGAARWRKLHQFTLLAWSLGLVHAFFAGTDASTLWLRLVFLWTAVPILVLFVVRATEPRRRAARRAKAPAKAPRTPRTPRPGVADIAPTLAMAAGQRTPSVAPPERRTVLQMGDLSAPGR